MHNLYTTFNVLQCWLVALTSELNLLSIPRNRKDFKTKSVQSMEKDTTI